MRVVGGRHLIQFSLESAILSGVEEIVVVVGYRAESIINAFGISYRDIRIRYVLQRELKGLVDAMDQAREALEEQDFILLLGDEILRNPRPREMIACFQEQNLFALCGVAQVTDLQEIKKTYAVLHNPYDNRIYRLIEKPKTPTNSYMGTGNCVFSSGILDYIEATPTHPIRRERELPDLIQCAVDDGHPVKLFVIGTDYVNVNTADDMRIAADLHGREKAPWRALEPVLP
jgi:dTDP-glucose pyrophosphorylase